MIPCLSIDDEKFKPNGRYYELLSNVPGGESLCPDMANLEIHG